MIVAIAEGGARGVVIDAIAMRMMKDIIIIAIAAVIKTVTIRAITAASQCDIFRMWPRGAAERPEISCTQLEICVCIRTYHSY